MVELNSSGDVFAQANNDLTTQGAQLNAGNLLVLNAGGNLRLDAVNDQTYSYYHTSSRSWYGSTKSTTRESQRIRSVGTTIAAENFLTNSNIDDLALDKVNNVDFIGSDINVNNETVIRARGDVNVYAALEYDYDRNESSKSGFLGLSSSSSGSSRSQQLLKASNLSNRKGDLSLLSGSDITVVASNLTSGKNINLQADNNILITAAEQLGKHDKWSIESGFFSGGDLYRSTENREGSTTRQYIGANINAANDINIKAARAKVIGSSLIAGNNIKGKTDVGDIEILSVANNDDRYKYEKEVKVSLGDFIGGLTQADKLVNTDNNRLTIRLAKATYDEVSSNTGTITQTGSYLQAGNNIELNAAGDINIQGSQLIANTDEKGTGDILLSAKGNINIEESKNRLDTKIKETHGEAELSLVVQHQVAEVANATMELDKAKNQLKQANEDYRQYQKDLSKQKNQLARLEQAYENKEPGISYTDIQEMREIIQSAEDDKSWYEAGLATATLNVTSKGTLLIQQTGAAAQSAGTYGFNAGLQLEIDATKTKSESIQTSSVASILQGRNIRLNNEGDSQIKGSHLNATQDLSINTRNLTVLASQDTYDNKSQTEHGKITVTHSVYGGAGGATVNASMDKSRAKNSQIYYTNSTLKAKNVTIVTQADTTIRGGNVHASDHLNMDVGKNLTLESVQNRSQGKNNRFSLSGGFGKNKKGNVNSVNAGLGVSSGQSRTRETLLSSLTSGDRANIKVKERTHITGALIATVDENNKDLGRLQLSTKSFSFENLSNTSYNNNKNAGLSTSIGLGKKPATTTKTTSDESKTKINTSTIQYSNNTGYSKTKTLATLGQGNINITDASESNNLLALNRDTNNTNKELYDINRQQGNIDLTIDHRLFSEEGHNKIKEDYKRTEILASSLMDLGDTSVSFFGNKKDGESSFREHLMKNQDFYTAAKNFADVKKLAVDDNRKYYIETLTNGNASVKDKQNAFTQLANAVAIQLGIPLIQAKLLIQQDSNLNTRGNAKIKGAYSKETNNIYVVDDNNKTTAEAVNTIGNELSHHVDHMRDGNAAYTKTEKYRKNRDSYSDIMGDAFEDYTSFAFALNGYDSLTAVNQNKGTTDVFGRPSVSIQSNIQTFNQLNPNEVEYRPFRINEAKVLDTMRKQINSDPNLSEKQKSVKLLQADAIACAEVNCAKVPIIDVDYPVLKKLQNLGEQFKKTGITLASLSEKDIHPNLFMYTWKDEVNDYLRVHDEGLTRIGGGVRTVGGALGIFGGASLSLGGIATCGVSLGLGCAAATTVGAPLAYLGYSEAENGINQIFGDYKSQVGREVRDAFSVKTHQDKFTPAGKLGVGVLTLVAEYGAFKVGTHYAKKGINKWKQSRADKKYEGLNQEQINQLKINDDYATAQLLAQENNAASILKGEVSPQMKTDPYHVDWKRYEGAEPRAVGADVVNNPVIKKNSWNEFQKGTKGQYSSRKEASAAYDKLKTEKPPYPNAVKPQDGIMHPGERFNMVIEEGRNPKRPGGFGTLDDIPDQDYARNKLAITKEFKRKDDLKVQQYEVIKPLPVTKGPVGPQIDTITGDYRKGGGTQFKMEVPMTKRSDYIKPVEKAKDIR